MGFVALKPIDMHDGTTRMPGQMIPEAAAWPHLSVWARQGYVAAVVDGKEHAFMRALAAGKSAQEYAPTVKPEHLVSAARHLQHGTGPTADLSPSTVEPVPSASHVPVESPKADAEKQAAPAKKKSPAKKPAKR